VDDLDKIHVPVLVLNGRFDEVQDIAVQPLVAGIKDVRWVRFEESSHLPFVEEETKYGAEVASFLG
jgi:pimeloyl-ACP methyl ester carboxylesterase